MKKLVIALVVLGVPMLLIGASAQQPQKGKGPKYGVAVIHGFKDANIKGVIHFTATEDGVQIKGKISGLTEGQHGFHVHEFGDVSSDDKECHGAHFNPEKKKHGGPDSEERHVGDLGNITANASGEAMIDLTDKVISLGGRHSIIGRSVIIHAKADDLKTDPAGDAGARIAGGVVGIGHAPKKHE
jgi:superoxide dismutase, Cu-Zn family